MEDQPEHVKIVNWIQWLVFRLSLIEVEPIEVQKRSYYPNKKILFAPIRLSDTEAKDQLQKANLSFQLEQKRRDVLTDKVKTLVSLGTFSLTFSVALFNFLDIDKMYLPLLILLGTSVSISILLCLNFLAINKISIPTFSTSIDTDNEVRYVLNKEKTVCEHLQELVHCCDYNHRVTDFLADVYRSAQRYFVLTIMCIVTMLVALPLNTKSNKASNTYIFQPALSSEMVVDNVYVEFDFDKHDLREADAKILFQKLERYNSGYEFSIIGYTDKIGQDPYNNTLSTMRASSIARWLVSNLNIPPKHITIMGGGMTEKYGNSVNKQGNRRAVIFILKQVKP